MKRIKVIDLWGLGDSLLLVSSIATGASRKVEIDWLLKTDVHVKLFNNITSLGLGSSSVRPVVINLGLLLSPSNIVFIPHGYNKWKVFLLRIAYIAREVFYVERKHEAYYLKKSMLGFFNRSLCVSDSIFEINQKFWDCLDCAKCKEVSYDMHTRPSNYVTNFKDYDSINADNSTAKDSVCVFPGSDPNNPKKRLTLGDVWRFCNFSEKILVLGPSEYNFNTKNFSRAGYKIVRIDNFDKICQIIEASVVVCGDNFFSHYCSCACGSFVYVIDKVGDAKKYRHKNIGYITK